MGWEISARWQNCGAHDVADVLPVSASDFQSRARAAFARLRPVLASLRLRPGINGGSYMEQTHPVDERLPVAQLIPLGLQHVLVMYAGAVAVPLIIGRALK